MRSMEVVSPAGIGFLVNWAATLPGTPETESVTGELKPPEGVMVTRLAPELSSSTVRVDGLKPKVKVA